MTSHAEVRAGNPAQIEWRWLVMGRVFEVALNGDLSAEQMRAFLELLREVTHQTPYPIFILGNYRYLGHVKGLPQDFFQLLRAVRWRQVRWLVTCHERHSRFSSSLAACVFGINYHFAKDREAGLQFLLEKDPSLPFNPENLWMI
ncbi:MAG: hypothetical protein HC915_20685 [Anaerolineae bacterium]|nr:hypothetical protein [Anaerolineae bacterium]